MATLIESRPGEGGSAPSPAPDRSGAEPETARRQAAPPRELGRFVGSRVGPTLICLAGLHGNEPAGVAALANLFRRLQEDPTGVGGQVVGLAGNRKALAAGRRFLAHDLNRAWTEERIASLRAGGGKLDAEDQEQQELDFVLQRLIDEAPGRVFLLDIHTFSGPGTAFAILDDTLPNREVALDLPVPLVLGLEEELSGTLASYLTTLGVTVVGFEAGQHHDPRSVDRAEAAIWIAMDSCGVVASASRPEPRRARRLLRAESGSAGRIVEVRYRHPIVPGDGFAMVPGFEGFQPVRAGEVVAASAAGPVRAPRSALLLMPRYQDQGEDGFFLVQEIRPFWLSVSSALRRLHAERVLHWLPGVRRHPYETEAFLVDRRRARWLARQLFHLAGFRQVEKDGPILLMRRRRDEAPAEE